MVKMRNIVKILGILIFFAIVIVFAFPTQTLCEENSSPKAFTVPENIKRLKDAKKRMRIMIRKYGKTLGGIFGEDGEGSSDSVTDKELLESAYEDSLIIMCINDNGSMKPKCVENVQRLINVKFALDGMRCADMCAKAVDANK
jgi:hypothetical protein